MSKNCHNCQNCDCHNHKSTVAVDARTREVTIVGRIALTVTLLAAVIGLCYVGR